MATIDSEKGNEKGSGIGHDAVWFITGSSTGFGRELAELILTRGGNVVATARKPESLDDLVKQHGERCLALALDVTNSEQVKSTVHEATKHFGHIDVLVNNAGYGYLSALEDAQENQYRQQFETNFFGIANLIQQVLPGMRARQQGHIVNLSSVTGFMGMPSTAFYSGSKFALEGLSEALAAEVQPLGISVTIVEPSAFRTDFSGRSLQTSAMTNSAYADTVGATIGHLQTNTDIHQGDPKRAAAAIVDMVNSGESPMRLLLGAKAVDLARMKIASWTIEVDQWEQVARDADFPQE